MMEMGKSQRVRFVVPCEPRPLARHRARIVECGTRRWVQTYQPKGNKLNIGIVRQFAALAMREDKQPLEGPLELIVRFWRRQPQSKRVKNRAGTKMANLLKKLFPISKPDLDNYEKLVQDACNKVVWVDDAQVCRSLTEKWYTTGLPRIEIEVRQMRLEDLPTGASW